MYNAMQGSAGKGETANWTVLGVRGRVLLCRVFEARRLSKIKMLASAGARWLCGQAGMDPTARDIYGVTRRPGLSCAVARCGIGRLIPVSDELHRRCHLSINTMSVTVSNVGQTD